MGLYELRKAGRILLKPVLKVFVKFHPDVLTWFSLIFAISTGLCYYFGKNRILLLIAIPLILLRMAMNVLDGMVLPFCSVLHFLLIVIELSDYLQ